MTSSTNDIMANTPTGSSSDLAVEANRQETNEMQTALQSFTSTVVGNKQTHPIDDEQDENGYDDEMTRANTVTGDAVAKRRKLRLDVSEEEHVSDERLYAQDATVGNKESVAPAKEGKDASDASDKIVLSEKNDVVESSPALPAAGFSPVVADEVTEDHSSDAVQVSSSEGMMPSSPPAPFHTMLQTLASMEEDTAFSTDFSTFATLSATPGSQGQPVSGFYPMPAGFQSTVNYGPPFSSPTLPELPSVDYDTYELTRNDYGIMASEDYVLPISDYPLEELYIPGSPLPPPPPLPTDFSNGYYSFTNTSLETPSLVSSTVPSMGDQDSSFTSFGASVASPPSSPPAPHADYVSMFQGTTPMDSQEYASAREGVPISMESQESALLSQESVAPTESEEILTLSREFPSPIPSDLVAIQEIKGKGHGIVALRPIQAGTRILSETALVNTLPFSVKHQTLNLERNELYVARQLALLDYPNLAAYFTLTPGRKFSGRYRNTDVILSNGFEVMIAPDTSVVKLFRNTSLYNHSCTPNTYWHFDYSKKEIVTQVIKDVAAGEELTICYIEDGLSHAERQSRLREFYNFTCTCPLCSGTPDELANKDHIIAEFKKLHGYSGYLTPFSPRNQTDALAERLKYYSVLTYMTVLEIEGQMPMHQIFVGARRFFSTDQQRKYVLGLLAWEAVQRYMGADSDEAGFLISELPGLPVHYWQGLARLWSALETEKKVSVWKWVFEEEGGDCPRVGPFDVLYRRGNVEW